jgi:hypothetical protein
MLDADYCFMHNPDKEEEAAEARRTGGIRRRRERVLAGAYEWRGFAGPESILRILDIATFDTLSLESSIARNRTLITAAGAAQKQYEVAELVARIELLEDTLRSQRTTDRASDDSALEESA